MSARTAEEEDHIYTDAFVGDRSWNGRERNQLLWNRGDGTFVEAGAAFGMDDMRDARGCAAADYDHDGDIDFVVNEYRAPVACFENQVGQRKRWLAVRLAGAGPNTDGIGATVTVLAGGRRHTAVIAAGSGYASQHSLEAVFGLGDATQVEDVWVSWPGGAPEAYGPCAVDQRLVLEQGKGGVRARSAGPQAARPPVSRAAAGLLILAVLGLGGVALSLLRHPMAAHG